jgi:tryptophanyl-tRNA synthetase
VDILILKKSAVKEFYTLKWDSMMTDFSEEVSLIDAHAHLEELDDLSDALSKARSSGVKAIIAVGMDLDSNKRTLEIART